MKRTHDAATCNATQVQVEYEEKGVALKVAPCTRCRQLLCPSCDFAAWVQRIRLLLQQRQVVQRIEDHLLAPVCAAAAR